MGKGLSCILVKHLEILSYMLDFLQEVLHMIMILTS